MKNWARANFAAALQRIDLLIHREILRLRASYQLSLDEFRGLYISDRQVDELIRQQDSLGHVDVSGITTAAAELLPRARLQLAGDRQWQTLCHVYQLSETEQDVLLLAFAPELHSKYPTLFAYLNNDITRKFPTVELALNLFCQDSTGEQRRVFASESTLLDKGLIVPVARESEHYSLQSGFVIAPVVREFLLGHSAIDLILARTCRLLRKPFCDWRTWPFRDQVVSQFETFATVLQGIHGSMFFVVEAPPGNGTDELAGNSLAAAGLACCRVELKQLLADRDNAGDAMRSLCQAALLERAGLVIEDLSDLLEPGQGDRALLSRFFRRVEEAGIACFLLVPPKTRWWELLACSRQLLCRIDPAGVPERQDFWQHHLCNAGAAAAEEDIVAVADYFQLGYQQVRAAAQDLVFRQGGHRISREQLFAAARRQSHGDMGELADRVDKNCRISDLVLPGAILLRIKEIIAAIKSRRLVFGQWDLQRRTGSACGIVSLFAGASGTGKTMTASAIANEIGLDLYRIELSGVVSKYIGETEKNLDRIFAAARKANCILFFDEADALFGKRSEVKDAHDRYANIEVAYLLQKIENHDGVVMLTTNLAKSIDQAFTRRMQFIVEFPRPDVAAREQLWRGMFGDSVPLADDVDFNFLARQLENTGGDIKNMVLDAALMAAARDDKIIDMALLVRAAARQMIKQGRVPSAVEFKHYFSLVDNRTPA